MLRSKWHFLVPSPKTSLTVKSVSCVKWSHLHSVLLASTRGSKHKKGQDIPKGPGYAWILSQR